MQKKNIIRIICGMIAVTIFALAAYLVPKYGFVGSYYAIQAKLDVVKTSVETKLRSIAQIPTARASQAEQNSAMFSYRVIDENVAGDCKLVGDISGDGYPDLIVGGVPSEFLNWYRYPDWKKTVIAKPNTEFTTDCGLGDVDKDGDQDIIVPDGGETGSDIVWFENPLPSGDPLVTSQWKRRQIGTIDGPGKDVKPFDYDGDGRLDVATRTRTQVIIFFQNSASWTKLALENIEMGNEGMAMGDVDKDANQDLVLHGVWVRNPGGLQARTASNWKQYTIGAADTDFKALVVDLNRDGKMDVVYSSSENSADVNWWTPSGSDPTGAWIKHLIIANMDRTHTLQAADMDLDGDIDIVLGQMQSAAGEIFIMNNANGLATVWEKQHVGDGGLHNGVVADVGKDGDFDIFGANYTGNPPVKLWENRLESLITWKYKEVTSANQQTFGLAFGDVDKDKLKDIISGQFWFKNPGGDMMGTWTPSQFPAGMQACLFTDVDGDGFSDVIAQKTEGDLNLYWLEATNAAATTWKQVLIGTMPHASHELGAQGYKIAQIEAGGKPEIVFSSGNGIYYFRIPTVNPDAGGWQMVHVSSNPSDEGLGIADINNDGKLDIAATTGDTRNVQWYKNPGTNSGNWTAYTIGHIDANFPDRTEAADFNGDNKPDIIVTEENQDPPGAENANTYWWEQPTNPTSTNWTRHNIVTQGTTNSMDIGDINNDGRTDITLAEHRGEKRLTVWLNKGKGTDLFEPFLVDSGRESHLGARLVDIDGDRDLDIVSIAWDDYGKIHLWMNARVLGEPNAFIPFVTVSRVTNP